jgi:transcriptional regulator with XRE-family HTH domain
MAKKFGDVLRRLREQSGKTMGALARELRVSVTYLSDVERNQRPPLTLQRIQQALSFIRADDDGANELHAAATAWTNTLELPVKSDAQRAAGAALMRGWEDFDEHTLGELIDFVRKKTGE